MDFPSLSVLVHRVTPRYHHLIYSCFKIVVAIFYASYYNFYVFDSTIAFIRTFSTHEHGSCVVQCYLHSGDISLDSQAFFFSPICIFPKESIESRQSLCIHT